MGEEGEGEEREGVMPSAGGASSSSVSASSQIQGRAGLQHIGVTSMNRWWYVLAAFIDFEANFLVISAFNYTSFTSVALLDCFTIPSAMALSYFFLGCR